MDHNTTEMLVKNIGLIFMVTDKFTIRVILDYCNIFTITHVRLLPLECAVVVK